MHEMKRSMMIYQRKKIWEILMMHTMVTLVHTITLEQALSEQYQTTVGVKSDRTRIENHY